QVEADVLEIVSLNGEEARLDGDLDGAGFAELLEQALEEALVLGGLGDDELALKLLDGADGPAGVAPAIGGDGIGNELGDVLDELLSGALLLLAALPALAGAEEALPAAPAAATTAAAGLSLLVLKAELRRVVEVGDLDDHVADVIDAGQRVLGQVFVGRNGDDAFVDGVAELHRAAADV